MKTEAEVRKEIKDLLFRASVLNMNVENDKKEAKRLKSELKFLQPILLYLETNPSKDFCEAELAKAQKRLEVANDHYSPLDETSGRAEAVRKKSFEAEWDVPTIKAHIKNLKFILDK